MQDFTSIHRDQTTETAAEDLQASVKLHRDGVFVRRFQLQPRTTIGRATENTICLPELGISRKHCELQLRNDTWFFVDCGSRNGCLVQGTQIFDEVPLNDAELISIGPYDLELVIQNGSPRAPRNDQHETVIGSSQQSDTILMHTSELSAGSTTEVAVTELHDFAIRITGITDQAVKATLTLQMLLNVTHGLCGAVQYVNYTAVHAAETGFQESNSDAFQNVAVSATTGIHIRPRAEVSQAVLDNNDGILVNGPVSTNAFQFMQQSEITSFICVPIRFGDRVLGLIHLYSTNPNAPLDPDDLRLCDVAARVLGSSLCNVNTTPHTDESPRTSLTVASDLVDQKQVVIKPTEEVVLGDSYEMSFIRNAMASAAANDLPVLIHGETGVGKSLIAKCIHQRSARASHKLIRINCAALNEEMFDLRFRIDGNAASLSKLEQAKNGTLILDSIDELPVHLQKKLIGILDDAILDNDDSETQELDIRLIAISRTNPESLLESGRLLGDLLYRLQTIVLDVPPLRDRSQDIPRLVESFLSQTNQLHSTPAFSPKSLDKLCKLSWPGNVRQLQGFIEHRMAVATEDGVTDFEPRDLDSAGHPDPDSSKLVPLSEMEKNYIRRVLLHTNGKKLRAAKILGIGRSTLDRKIDRYGIEIS